MIPDSAAGFAGLRRGDEAVEVVKKVETIFDMRAWTEEEGRLAQPSTNPPSA